MHHSDQNGNMAGPMLWSFLDIGCDTCSPVSDLYETPFAFTGTIFRVMVDVSAASLEELKEQHGFRARFATATQ